MPEKFNGQRMRVVRIFYDYTHRDLAELIAVSPGALSRYESQEREPDAQIVAALCDVLGVERDYFYHQLGDEMTESECNFRRLRSTPQKLRRRVLAHGTLLAMWVQRLKTRVRLPAFDLPSFEVDTTEDIERAAEACREHWGLGDAPLRSVSRILENAGVIVIRSAGETTKIDAFSRFGGSLNVIVLNTSKGSNSRAIFDSLHEIGHGVLHRDVPERPLKEKETEANYFAGALLLPRRTFPREFWAGGGFDLSHLVDLKQRWGTSIQAILYRAHQLGLLNSAEFRRWQRTIARKGWRRGVPEPAEPDEMVPELLDLAYEKYTEVTGQGAAQIAFALGWSGGLFERITGISTQVIDIGVPPDSKTMSLEEFRVRKSSDS